MPQRLHRLEVRNRMLAIGDSLGIPANHIVSREAGYIDVFVPRSLLMTNDEIKQAFITRLNAQGVAVAVIQETYERRRRVNRLRFQNDLMAQQAQWGARGMSRGYRLRNGIDADATPFEVAVVESGAPRARYIPPVRTSNETFDALIRRVYEAPVRPTSTVRIHNEVDTTPLVEEVQDEDDSDILSSVRVQQVALEASEL